MLEVVDRESVRIVRLARPPANALDPGLIAALGAAVEQAPRAGFRALTLSGTPGMFSAGLDVPHLLSLSRPSLEEAWRGFFHLIRALAASPIPIAAAITGHAPAGGAVLALYCDHRVMAEGSFKIGFNEVRVGIPLPAGIYRALELVVGPREAERCAVTGRLMDGAEARRIGLVDALAAAEAVEEQAVAWLEGLLALPDGAMSRTRQLARSRLVQSVEEQRESDVAATSAVWFSDETQAALRSMVDSLAKKKAK